MLFINLSTFLTYARLALSYRLAINFLTLGIYREFFLTNILSNVLSYYYTKDLSLLFV